MIAAEITAGRDVLLRAEWETLESEPRFSGSADLQAQALALDDGYSPSPVPAGFNGMRRLVADAVALGDAWTLRTVGIKIRESKAPRGTTF